MGVVPPGADIARIGRAKSRYGSPELEILPRIKAGVAKIAEKRAGGKMTFPLQITSKSLEPQALCGRIDR